MLRTPSLCYLLGYCYICTVRGGAKSVGDRFDHRCLYRSFTAGEEGREIASEDHTDLAVLIPSLIPFVLVVIVKWRKRISRDSSPIPRLNLLGDESRSLLQEEKLRVEAEVYTSWRR